MDQRLQKRFWAVLFGAVILCGTLQGQGDLRSLLSQGHTLQEHGEYLVAARLFGLVGSQSRDSVLIADALYSFVTTGDSAAIRFTRRLHATNTTSGDRAQSRAALLKTLKEDVDSLAGVGIKLRLTGFEHDDYVNTDTTIRRLLSVHFANTPAGEQARFDLIDDDGCESPHHDK